MELRCDSSILHGIMIGDGVLELPCRSRWCGKQPGVVVLHRFNVNTGELIETLRFSEPSVSEEGNNGAGQRTAVRPS